MGPEIQVSWPTFALGYLPVDPPSIHPAIRHPARGIFQHLGFCQSSCWSEPFVIRIQTFCDQDPDPNQLCDPDPDQKVCDPDPDKTHLWSGSKPFVIRIRTFCDPNPNLLWSESEPFVSGSGSVPQHWFQSVITAVVQFVTFFLYSTDFPHRLVNQLHEFFKILCLVEKTDPCRCHPPGGPDSLLTPGNRGLYCSNNKKYISIIILVEHKKACSVL